MLLHAEIFWRLLTSAGMPESNRAVGSPGAKQTASVFVLVPYDDQTSAIPFHFSPLSVLWSLHFLF